MATYDEILRQVISAYEVLAQTEPDLVARELDPGGQATFTVDTDMGAVNVIVQVPAPLAPAAGETRVVFREGTPTQVQVTQTP